MAKTLYFLKYNNYANRIMKRENSLSDYLAASYDNTYIQKIEDCKLWNPNDGITTSITTPLNTDFTIEPDYLLATDPTTGAIDSKWFVVECVRTLKGQYTCALKRDVFAEAWDELMTSTCNIDRAILSKYNKLIFNSEPITVNEILTDETLIKDKTGCPWIVFYAKQKPDFQITIPKDTFSYAQETNLSKDDWIAANTFVAYSGISTQAAMGQIYLSYKLDADGSLGIFDTFPQGLITPLDQYDAWHRWEIDEDVLDGVYPKDMPRITAIETAYNRAQTTMGRLMNYINTIAVTPPKSAAEKNATLLLDGQIIYSSADDKYYQVVVNPSSYLLRIVRDHLDNTSASDNLYNYVVDTIRTTTNCSAMTAFTAPAKDEIFYTMTYQDISVDLIAVADYEGYQAQLPALGTTTIDSAYNMWCMPYGEITMKVESAPTKTSDGKLNLRIAKAMMEKASTDLIYDFQILPFCPLPDEVVVNGGIQIDSDSMYAGGILTDPYTILNENNSTVGYIFACPNSTFKRQIMLDDPITVDDPKLRNITDVWRLYSPNYSSSFEFSAAKNDGITGFNIRCTYMPISPYIRVAPIWGGLYGEQFFEDDPRGLICRGDYSLPRTQSAWVQYQEQNKNYEAIFDRQIENMDVMRKYERINQIVAAGAGGVQGASKGAKLGTALAPGAGTIAGAVGGAAAGLGAGVADVFLGEARYSESKSYATDMHVLQLGNVQAMPRTLSKTTAFNIDNRYFPVLALYRCSSDELVSVANFIKNRSMDVGTIGSPSNFVNNTWEFAEDRGFMQGSIIYIDTIHDTHFVDELNKEFQKGVYQR